MPELDAVCDIVRGRVLPGYGERAGGGVGRDDAEVLPAHRERDGDRAAARTDVHDEPGARREDGVHEGLGLRARDEHARIHREAQPVELLPAAQIRYRLTAGATLEEPAKCGLQVRLDRRFRVRVEVFLRDPERVGKEDIGIERRDPRERRRAEVRSRVHGGKYPYRRQVLGIQDVRAARAVADRHLERSPLERSPFLSEACGVDVHLKLEVLRPTRSFKVRGALNRLSALDAGAHARGVVTASGGNHGQGVAYAAHALGTSAVIVMPETVAPSIVEVCRSYGAEVVLRGAIYDDTVALAHEIEREQGRTFVHAYGDPLVIAGQGTIGLEILEDLADVDAVVVPVGGGGLVCGIALAIKEGAPRPVRVIGVEPEGSNNLGRSVAAGRPVTLDAPSSIAERLVAKSTEPLNLELAIRYVDEFVTVDDGAIGAASYEYLERLSLLVEPSGAATLAALRSGRFEPGKRTVLVVSGGNTPTSLLARVIRRGRALPDTRARTRAGAAAPA